MPSLKALSVAGLAVVAACAPIRGSAQDTTALDPVRIESRRDHYLMLGAGVLGASLGGQVLGTPTKWSRTWEGYGKRLGDQIGFAVAEETTAALVSRAVSWEKDRTPCVSAGRPGVFRALSCGANKSFTLRTPEGERRPNLPFITGVLAGTAASLVWRPEGENAVKARSFFAQRMTIVFGASVLKNAYTEWGTRH